jgi:hypothetical protein
MAFCARHAAREVRQAVRAALHCTVLARGGDPPEPPAVLARGGDPPEPPAVLARGGDPPEPPAMLARGGGSFSGAARADMARPSAVTRR